MILNSGIRYLAVNLKQKYRAKTRIKKNSKMIISYWTELIGLPSWTKVFQKNRMKISRETSNKTLSANWEKSDWTNPMMTSKNHCRSTKRIWFWILKWWQRIPLHILKHHSKMTKRSCFLSSWNSWKSSIRVRGMEITINRWAGCKMFLSLMIILKVKRSMQFSDLEI